ncbi:hypothetical protein LCGC14_2807190, partial [marine sediment metagenome]
MEEIKFGKGEKRYHDLLANISDVVVETDLIGKFLYVSPQCEQIFGFKPEFFIGKTVFQFTHPEDIQKITEWMKQALVGEVKNLEYRIKKADGSYAHVSAKGRVTEIENKKRFIAVIRDITERKSMEELLQKTQEIARIGSFEMNLSTNDVVWSNQVYKLFGLEKEGRFIDYEKVMA